MDSPRTILSDAADTAPQTAFVKQPVKSVTVPKKSKAKSKKQRVAVAVAAHKRRYPKTDTPGMAMGSLTGPTE